MKKYIFYLLCFFASYFSANNQYQKTPELQSSSVLPINLYTDRMLILDAKASKAKIKYLSQSIEIMKEENIIIRKELDAVKTEAIEMQKKISEITEFINKQYQCSWNGVISIPNFTQETE